MGAVSGTDPLSRGAGATTDSTLRVTLASDTPAPLPIGGATAAKQDDQTTLLTAGNASLASLDTKTPAKGAAATAGSSPVSLATDSAFLANGGAAVAVVGRSAVISVAQTVTAALYASGNAIGGKITLANAVAEAAGASLLHQIVILDRSNTKPSGYILIFNADPSAATITDKSAFVFSTDDLKCVARIPVAASDYASINSKAVADLNNLGRLIKATAGTTLYAAFVSDGVSVPTFAATSDLNITFKFLPN